MGKKRPSTRHDGLRVCVSWSILWLDVRLLVLSWHDIAHVDMFTGRVVSTHYCRLVWKSRPTITTSNPTQGEKNKQTPQKSSFGKILIESWMNQKKTQRKRNSKLNCVILSTPKFRLFPFLVFSFIWDSHETVSITREITVSTNDFGKRKGGLYFTVRPSWEKPVRWAMGWGVGKLVDEEEVWT